MPHAFSYYLGMCSNSCTSSLSRFCFVCYDPNVGNCNRGGPAASEPIDPPHIPWKVYAYCPDGFARERIMPRNPNVMGYPFPTNT